MNWRKKINTEHLKEWHSGPYVVRWRDQCTGVNIQAGYQALVKAKVDERIIIDSVWRDKVFRTRHATMQACEDHAGGLNPAEIARRRKFDKKKRPKRKRVIAMIERELDQIEAPKKRGRPKKIVEGYQPILPDDIVNVSPEELETPKRRGRPKGGKNKAPRKDRGVKRGPRK